MTTTKSITALSLLALTILSGGAVYKAFKFSKDKKYAAKTLDSYYDGLAQEVLHDDTFVEGDIREQVNTQMGTVVPVDEQIRRHRRLPHKGRGNYINSLICEIKNKVGVLSDRESNRMVVRRLAKGLMDTHGLRPTHQAQIMPMIVELCLIPNKDECNARQFGLRDFAMNRKAFRSGGWKAWLNPFDLFWSNGSTNL